MLRLEHLFNRLDVLAQRDAAVDHHFALVTLFEIMDVAARADVKSDLLKELDRQRLVMAGFRGNPQIEESVLNGVIGRIEQAFSRLNQMAGKVGQSLTTNEWLMAIRSRVAIPGGTCEFDLPAYYAWQQHSPARRQSDLKAWIGTLSPLSDALRVYLGLLRESGVTQTATAPQGQFQQSLPPGRTYHLLRLRLPQAAEWVPEITGHRLLVMVRLMKADGEGRVRPFADAASFQLTLCS